MTEIERKALALVNEAFLEPHYEEWSQVPQGCVSKALIRAIEQHEAFRQEVSDVVVNATHTMAAGKLVEASGILAAFITPKPDPLVEALKAIGASWPEAIDRFRAALAARGLKIVEDKA